MKAELSRRGLLALGTAALTVGRVSGAGNTLVYGMNTNPGTLRPFEQGGLAGTAIKMMTQRTLTTYTPDGKIVPCLAAFMEPANADAVRVSPAARREISQWRRCYGGRCALRLQ